MWPVNSGAQRCAVSTALEIKKEYDSRIPGPGTLNQDLVSMYYLVNIFYVIGEKASTHSTDRFEIWQADLLYSM